MYIYVLYTLWPFKKEKMNPRGEECVLFSAATEILMRYEEEEEKNWIEPTRLRPADPSGQDLFFIIFSSSCYFDLEVKKIKKKVE